MLDIIKINHFLLIEYNFSGFSIQYCGKSIRKALILFFWSIIRPKRIG